MKAGGVIGLATIAF